MGLFRKKENKTIAELEQYYAGGNKNGMAWIMALLSLVITVVVLTAIFLAGKWVWNKVTDNDSSDTTTSATTSQEPIGLSYYDIENQGQPGAVITFTDNGEVTVSTDSNGGQGTVDSGAVSTDVSNSERISSLLNSDGTTLGQDNSSNVESSSSSESSASDSSSALDSSNSTNDATTLPNTGVSSSILALPIVVGAAGYVVSVKRYLGR